MAANGVSTTVTADGNYPVTIEKSGMYQVNAAGTWGSGTATVQVLPIGGSSYVGAVDSAGNAMTFTADGVKGLLALSIGTANISMSGSSSPSVKVTFTRISAA